MKLEPPTLRLLSDLLDVALDLPDNERDAWLDTLAGERAQLRPVLVELLRRHASMETGDLIGTLPGIELPATGDSGVAPGALLGAYVLVRPLGHGGMGEVWLAERHDGLIRRPLAIKLPRMTGHPRVLAERFAREREILAQLDHPHIARLYDAGVANGQPFLALEYVDGQAITAYGQAHSLSVRDRVALFLQVLDAVQYAHAHLVLHRDLKPNNILVAADGTAKLLDFGIAKLMDSDSVQETELTQAGGRALTPDYASPEQITGAPVTTASDVYSLGVVFYELLCGARPYRARRASRAAMEDAIVEEDALRPSVTARDAGAAPRLVRDLAGDLDAIALKALRKVPAERYATAEAFADDLRRYLDGRPVLAQPERAWYRLRKLVARHRVAALAVAAVVVAVGAGVTLALWQAREAREQAARATALADFIVGVFNQNSAAQKDPEAARRTTVRELLDVGKARLLAGNSPNPAVADRLLETFSELYFQLGLHPDTIALDEARVRNAESAYGASDLRTLEAQRALATVYMSAGRMDDARILGDKLLAALDQRGLTSTPLRAKVLGLLSQTYLVPDPEKALRYLREEAVLLRACCTDDLEFPLTLANLALAEAVRGEPKAAGLAIEEAARALDAQPGGGPKHVRAYVQGFAASIMGQLDRPADAEKAARDAVATSAAASGPGSAYTYNEKNRLASVLLAMSRQDEARALAGSTLAATESAPDSLPHVPVRARALLTRASALDPAHVAEAAAHVPVLVALLGKPIDPATRGEVLHALLEHALASGRADDAAVLVPAVRELAAGRLFAKAAGVASFIALAAEALARTGRVAEARALLDAETQRLGTLQVVPLAARVNLGIATIEVLDREGREAEARALAGTLRAAIAARSDRTYFSRQDARLEKLAAARS